MDLEIRHLRYVVAVADTLNFSRAAEQLHMSQPALSARVKAIERHLDVALFQRTTRSVSCTEAGARFTERAREILRLMTDAEQECRQAGHGRQLWVGFYGDTTKKQTATNKKQKHKKNSRVEVELRRYGGEDPSA